MAKKKTDRPAEPTDRKKGLTFRLDDEDLAFQLRMVVEAKGTTVAKYLKPLIREQIEADFALLGDKIQDVIRKTKQK